MWLWVRFPENYHRWLCCSGVQCFCSGTFKVSSLEAEIQKLNGEQLLALKDNINTLFKHCIATLGHEHHIRVVYALQVFIIFCALMFRILRNRMRLCVLDLLGSGQGPVNIVINQMSQHWGISWVVEQVSQVLISVSNCYVWSNVHKNLWFLPNDANTHSWKSIVLEMFDISCTVNKVVTISVWSTV